MIKQETRTGIGDVAHMILSAIEDSETSWKLGFKGSYVEDYLQRMPLRVEELDTLMKASLSQLEQLLMFDTAETQERMAYLGAIVGMVHRRLRLVDEASFDATQNLGAISLPGKNTPEGSR